MHRITALLKWPRTVLMLLVLLAATWLYGSAITADSESESIWTARNIVTTMSFNEPLLLDLGLRIAQRVPTALAIGQHPLSVTGGNAPAFASRAAGRLQFVAPQGRFDHFLGGSVRHHGGVELRFSNGVISLLRFELRPEGMTRSLELLDANGEGGPARRSLA